MTSIWGHLFGGRRRKSDSPSSGDLVAIVDDSVDPRMVLYHEPTGPHAEQYRAFRTNFLASQRERPGKRYLVTSAISGEGKSISTANIASCFAELPQFRIALVDADLRAPALANILSLPPSPGLQEVLQGLPVDEALQGTRLRGLHLLPAGAPIASPSQILLGTRMKEIFAQLEATFDYVFIDAPPVLAYSDAAVLAPSCDGVILVARIKRTPRPQIDRAAETIKAGGGNVVGVFLTGVPMSSGEESDYYGPA